MHRQVTNYATNNHLRTPHAPFFLSLWMVNSWQIQRTDTPSIYYVHQTSDTNKCQFFFESRGPRSINLAEEDKYILQLPRHFKNQLYYCMWCCSPLIYFFTPIASAKTWGALTRRTNTSFSDARGLQAANRKGYMACLPSLRQRDSGHAKINDSRQTAGMPCESARCKGNWPSWSYNWAAERLALSTPWSRKVLKSVSSLELGGVVAKNDLEELAAA